MHSMDKDGAKEKMRRELQEIMETISSTRGFYAALHHMMDQLEDEQKILQLNVDDFILRVDEFASKLQENKKK